MNESVEFSCSLSADEMRERRSMVQALLMQHVVSATAITNGLKIEFSSDEPELREKLLEFIALERQCCDFLRFNLSEPSAAGLCLLIEGSAQSTNIIRMFQNAIEESV